jgi:4-hydroxysphinganine ceramide fatty acyl 2-hydroxylase
MDKATPAKVYTKEDIDLLVEKKGRAIVIFEGDVYDATEFKATHPGGPKFIDDYVGKDITEQFYDEEHTKIALRLLNDLKIGTISPDADEQVSQQTVTDHSRMKEIEGEEWRKKVDPKKGTVYQVFKNLNHEEYDKFINDPKHLTRPDDEHRMFLWECFEIFSRTPWYHVALFWTPIVIIKLIQGCMQQTPMEVVLYLIFGLICWTFAEYSLHRFVFHMEVYMPDNKYLRTLHYMFHGVHHAFPMDGDRLVFPLIMANIFWFFFHKLWIATLPYNAVNTFTAGFIGSYMLYDLGHYYLHHSQPLKVVEFRKKYHMYHHYKDPDNGYGITTSFWDKIFGTELNMSKKQGKDNIAKSSG